MKLQRVTCAQMRAGGRRQAGATGRSRLLLSLLARHQAASVWRRTAVCISSSSYFPALAETLRPLAPTAATGALALREVVLNIIAADLNLARNENELEKGDNGSCRA